MSNYTPQDLSTIAQAPMLVGMAVSMADLGIISTAVEAAALGKEIAGAAAKYPNNSAIQSTFSEAALKSGTIKMEKPEIKPEEVQSGALAEKAIAAVNTALATLEGKATPEEIQEFKAFVYNCGEAVAKAAGSGLFGSGDPKVSDTEAATLTKLKAALGL
jgi:hypothetical protein